MCGWVGVWMCGCGYVDVWMCVNNKNRGFIGLVMCAAFVREVRCLTRGQYYSVTHVAFA